MKKLISLLLFALILITAAPVFAAADTPRQILEIHGVDVPCTINDRGILQIVLTEQTTAQIRERLRKDLKKEQSFIEIDLTGFENLNGFALMPSSWSAFTVELFEDIKIFVSPYAAMLIEDNASGGDVMLEAAYSFTKENQVSGIDLHLTSEFGYEIETVGVVSLPTGGYDYNLEYMALSRNGEVVAKSCVLDGLFYAAASLSGEYKLVEVQPTEFKDEIPSWAKSSVDWMSAREVIKGSEGLFRANDGITRAEFMTMFARLHNAKNGKMDSYYNFKDRSDIPEWVVISYLPTLLFDVEHDGFLYPNKVMTCGEVMKAVHSYIAFFDLFFDESTNKLPFTDTDTVEVSQGQEASMLSQRGVLSGGGGEKADMDEAATRAQVAELLCRFAKWITFNRIYR